MPLFQEATERKILVEMLKESIKPAPDIITNPDEIPCSWRQPEAKSDTLCVLVRRAENKWSRL